MGRSTNPEAKHRQQKRIHALSTEIWECVEQMLANLDHPEVLWSAIFDFKELTRTPPLPQSVQRLCALASQWIFFKQRHAQGKCRESTADGSLQELQLCFKRMGGPPAPPPIKSLSERNAS